MLLLGDYRLLHSLPWVLFLLVSDPINKYKNFQTKSWQISIIQIFSLYKGSPKLERILDVQFKFYLAKFHLNLQHSKQWQQPAFVTGDTFHKNWSRFHVLMFFFSFLLNQGEVRILEGGGGIIHIYDPFTKRGRWAERPDAGKTFWSSSRETLSSSS